MDERATAGTKVLVIGAGVVGVATTYALARRGVSVTLLERAKRPGLGTSLANGAQLSYGYTDALASPALLKRMPAVLLGLDPAFQVRSGADLDHLRWTLAFLRNCSAARFHANTLAGIELALRSRAAMADLLARHPLEFGHKAPGKLLLFDDPAALARASELAALKSEAGARQWAVGADEAVRIEPALASVAGRLAGAIWAPEEEVGDPHLFCLELSRVLEERYGVGLRFGASVTRILPGQRPALILEGGERLNAEQIVVCTGPDNRGLLGPLGLRPPIMPVRGHSVTLPQGPESPSASITDTSRKLVFCSLSGRMRLAGQADVGVSSAKPEPKRLASLLEAARQSLPHAADYEHPLSTWAGLRPVTPNSLPIIRRHGAVTLNLGHGALGWTYAMGAAEDAARLVAGE